MKVVDVLFWQQSSPQDCLYSVEKRGSVPSLGNGQTPNVGIAATFDQHPVDPKPSTFKSEK